MTSKTKKASQRDILCCYITIAKLISLLELSNLSPEVKSHCKAGLKVISILYAHKHTNSGIKDLSNREFDAFFKRFSDVYFKNRGTISVDMIMTSIELCIQHDVLTDISV